MKRNSKKSEVAILRHKAEELLKKRSSGNPASIAEVEMMSLLDEMKELMAELEQQNDELAKANDQAQLAAKNHLNNHKKLEFEFNERIKELRCHNLISELLSDSTLSIDEVCERMVHLIPSGWQFPGITEVQIKLRDEIYQTGDFESNQNSLHEEIKIGGQVTGYIEVYLPCDKLPADVLPFLPEESELLFSIAERLGNFVEKAESELLLLESEKKYNNAFQTSPYAIIISRAHDGRIIDVNDAFSAISGYSREEALIDSTINLNLWVNQAERNRVVQSLMEGKEISGKEYHFNTKTSGIVTGLFTAQVIQINNEHYIFSSINDISERKQSEKALRDSEALYRGILHASPDDITITDLAGYIRMASPSAWKMFGYDRFEDIEGRSIGEFIAPVDRERAQSEIARLQQGIMTGMGEYHAIRPDGGVFDIEVNGQFIRNSEGTPSGMVFIVRDISERKAAEEALTKQNSLLSNLIVNLEEGILLEDADRKILLTNHLFCEMFGIPAPPEALLGADCSDSAEQSKHLFRNPAKFLADINTILADKKMVLDNELELADGRHFMRDYIPTYVNKKYCGHLWKYRDITVRKQSELRLRESEEKFRTITEQTGDLIGIADLNGIITYASPASAGLFQISPEEMCGHPFSDFVAETDVDMGIEAFRNCLAGSGQVKNVEFRMKRADGSIFTGEFNGSKFNTGSAVGILVIIRDITDRKLAEDDLRKFRSISDQANSGTAISSLDGTFIYVNDFFARMHGWKPEELIGKDLRIVHNEEQLSQVEPLLVLIKTKGGFAAEEIFHTRKDGTSFPALMSAKVIYDKNNKAEYLSTTTIDITEKKAAEESLVKLSQAVEQNPVSIVITDLNGTIEYANAKACKSTGYILEELVGNNPRVLKSGDVPAGGYDDLWKTITAGKVWKGTFHNKSKEGELYWESATISPIFDKTGKITHYLAVKEDITELKKSEEALKASEAALHNLNTTLELKIKERTRQLLETNENLEKEIKYRLQAEAELAIEKQRLAAIIEGTNVGTWEWNIQTGETIFNDRLAEIIGCTLNEISPISIETWTNFAHPDDLKVSNVMLEKHFNGELAYYSLERRVKHKNGEWVWVLDRGKVHSRDKDGNPLLMAGTYQDISERKQSEKALVESEIRHSAMISNISDVIGIMGPDGKMKYISPNVEKYFGWQSIDLIGKEGWVTVHPDDMEFMRTKFLNLLQNGGTSKTGESRYRCKDGNYKAIELTATNLINNAVINGILINYHDITERKLNEEALHMSEKRFSLFMDYLPAVVFVKDHRGRTLFVNRYMEEAFGASAWLGKNMLQIFPNEIGEKILSDDLNSMQLGYQKLEESMVQLDGKLHHYETQKFSIDRSGQESWLGGISLDITARKNAEVEIVKSRDEAEKANRAKSEFLSRMSHELRTPMNSILGFAQLMSMGELSPKQKKSVDHILISGKHLLVLIDEVLDISRIESGRISFIPEPILAGSIIAEIMDTVQPLADAREIKIELEDSPANQLFVMSDRKLLKQVLINLMNNAVKYNRPGGSVFIKTETLPQDDKGVVSVRIAVKDTGMGIHPDDIPKLFIPFERVGAEKTQIEGSGLGLAVVKKIMAAIEGAVGVESVVGEGSTFWIDLPTTENRISWKNQNENNIRLTAELVVANKEIAVQNEDKANRANELVIANKELAFQNQEKTKRATELTALKKQHSMEMETAANTKTGTILYIEDNIDNAELVEEIIRGNRHGIDLIVSMYGKTAVQFATANQPDLILLDLNLPDMAGSQVLANLLTDEITKTIPVVILTADATKHQIKKLMAAGARDYLTKPLDINIFLKVVDKWIDQRK